MGFRFLGGSLPLSSGCCSTYLIALPVVVFASAYPIFSVPVGVIIGMLFGPIIGPITMLFGGNMLRVSLTSFSDAVVNGFGGAIVAFTVSMGTIRDKPTEGCGFGTFFGMILGIFVSFSVLQYGGLITNSMTLAVLISLPAYLIAGLARMDQNSADPANKKITIITHKGLETITLGHLYSRIKTPYQPPEGFVDQLEQFGTPPIKDLWLQGAIAQDTAFPTYSSEPSTPGKSIVTVESEVGAAGENIKLVVKVINEGNLAITGVTVTLDAPDGLEYTQSSSATVRMGSISPNGGFLSAIYWLKPLRCVDDTYGGIIVYRDAHDQSYTIEIPRERLINICPMLEGIESAKEIFTDCKYGALERNTAAFKFAGLPSVVFTLAESRLSSLVPAERIVQDLDGEGYLAYTCVVGKTKYGDSKFAAEIQVSGTSSGGVLTLSIYSNDERILSGFFVDIMDNVRQHVEILEESVIIKPTLCSNCGVPLNLTSIGSDLIYSCESCGVKGKLPPWFA